MIDHNVDSVKAQMAARIDRCLSSVKGFADDKAVNSDVGLALGLKSGEAVRQWRKNGAAPKIENIFGLVEYLRGKGVSTTPEYLMFGLTKGMPAMELRERIADEGEELELLRLYRSMNRQGQNLLITNARALQLSFARGHNVEQLQGKKKKSK